jgi:class III poly(R)-hydroxyalkanoic acid synthase PhaE subunit
MAERNGTNWGEQTEATMQTWVDAQKTLWENWFGLMHSVSGAPMYPNSVDQGQMLASKIAEAQEGGEPHARDIAEHLENVQVAMLRLMELSMNAWSAMLPMIESGQDWQSALQAYTEQMRQQLTQSVTGTANATQEASALWQQYLQQWGAFAQPWLQALQQTPVHFAQAAGDERLQLLELSDVYWGAWDQMFGRLINTPGLGITRELQEKFVAAFNAWLSVQRANGEYQIILTDTWVRAFEQFMCEVMSRAERGEPVSSLRDLTNLWVDVAEHVYGDAFRSDEYVRIQGQLLNSTMAYHIRQRAILEDVSSNLGLPTRSEVDAAHRNIYEMRKEIKALRRALQSLETQVA